MSILDHMSPRHLGHNCGGTILSGPLTDDGRQYYCDRCGAFCYAPDDEPVPNLPTGTDKAANLAASDAGELASPEAA
jgi:hypothetical protein